MPREFTIDEDGFYPTHMIQFWDEETRTQYRVLQHGDDDDVMIHVEVYVRHSEAPLEEYKCEGGGYMPPHAGGMGMWKQILEDHVEQRLTAEQACAMVDEQLFYWFDVFSCPSWLERATARVEHLLLNPEIRYRGEPVIQVQCGPAVLVQHNEDGKYVLSYDYEDGYREYVQVNNTTEVAKELYKVGMCLVY